MLLQAWLLNNDENPDADVKFYTDGSRRISPHTIILRALPGDGRGASFVVNSEPKKETAEKENGGKTPAKVVDIPPGKSAKKPLTRLPPTPGEAPFLPRSRINESFGVAHDTTNGAQIVLIGTDCHIAMAIIWKKTRRVEFV